MITTAPSSVTAGSNFALAAAAEDGFGNVDHTFNGMVALSLASTPAGAPLGGTLLVTANTGMAMFAGLTLDQASTSDTLTVSSSGLTSATTPAITVAAAAAAQLVVSQEPAGSVTAGTGFGLAVMAEDPFGNFASTYTGSVSLALANNPGHATLSGARRWRPAAAWRRSPD